jgi:hypothetical protein
MEAEKKLRLDLVFNMLGWKTRKSPRSTSSIAGLTPHKTPLNGD